MQWLKNRVLTPLVNSIRNGISEHVLSFSIALGFVSGIFPIPGLTMAVAVALCYPFRKRSDWKIVTLANLVVVPLEFLLMPAFLALGGIFTDGDPVSAPAIIAALQASLITGLLSFAGALVRAAIAWALLSPLLVWAVNLACVPLARYLIKRLT